MPNLKDLKVRINSVKSTQKITSAMKMVAASKLRRSQEQAESAKPYSARLEEMLSSLSSNIISDDKILRLLTPSFKFLFLSLFYYYYFKIEETSISASNKSMEMINNTRVLFVIIRHLTS